MMNSSFQGHYYQPHPPISTQANHPIRTKDDVMIQKTKSGGGGGGGKKQASKGGGGVRLSTDPQSVAARERRHRISHRLKTLQSLVPGASKLDTVSLLDHAIHYVHFLNSQIRFHQFLLLSSYNNHYKDSNVAAEPCLLLPPRDHYVGVVDPPPALPPPPMNDGGFEQGGPGSFWADFNYKAGVVFAPGS